MGLPNGEEIMIVGRTMWTQSTSVTDGQTDRQTDRITIPKTVQRRASHGNKKNAPTTRLYSVSQKKSPPEDLWQFFQNRWEFFKQILRAYYALLFTLEYEFLFNNLQLWRSYAILSVINPVHIMCAKCPPSAKTHFWNCFWLALYTHLKYLPNNNTAYLSNQIKFTLFIRQIFIM